MIDDFPIKKNQDITGLFLTYKYCHLLKNRQKQYVFRFLLTEAVNLSLITLLCEKIPVQSQTFPLTLAYPNTQRMAQFPH